MILPYAKCPRCRANQKFGQKRKKIGHDEYEIFIQCAVCRWKRVIMVGNHDTICIHREIERLKQRAKKDPRLEKVLNKKRELLVKRQSDPKTM